MQKHYNSGNMPGTQKGAVDKGVVWLSVNSTEKASGDYLEPAKLSAWQKERMAAATIVDPPGKLIYAGGIDSIASARADDIKTAVNYVNQGLAEALAGKPVSQATTRPYGCSIKYKT